jgi:hypothetical protein
VIRITGLPAALNGSAIQVGLFAEKDVTESNTIWGSEIASNGTLEASLLTDNGSSPWEGNGSYYVAFMSESDEKLYITKNSVSFNSATTTIGFSDFEETEMPGPEAAGYITGTIAFDGYAGERPAVRIQAEYYNQQGNWGWTDDAGRSYTVNADGTFEILFVQEFLDSLQSADQTLSFRLRVGSGNDSYSIYLEESKTISAAGLSNGNIAVGSLGTVSLASIILSGTINVTNDGSPIPRVSIDAFNANNSPIGHVNLKPTAADTQWSMHIPAQQGAKVSFRVYGYDSSSGGDELFYKTLEPAATGSVSNSNISGIALNIGDINDSGSEETLTGSVSISGTAQVGETLTANTSNLNGSGTISYTWLRGSSTISGATGSTYTLTTADIGASIKVRVSRSGMSGSIESSQVGPVTSGEQTLTGSVSITGTAQVGSTLTANTSNLNGSGTISYTWLRGSSTISGATGSTYTLTTADIGASIKVRVSRSGVSGSIESPQVGPVTSGGGGDEDTLTVSNGPIFYTVYVTTTTLTSSSSYLSVATDYTNLKATGSGSGDSAALTWISGGESGSYNVLIYAGTTTKYQNNVSFSNGSASLNWNTMSTAGSGSGGGSGSFTISGLPSGTYSVFAVTGNPSTYFEAIGSGSYSGTGAIISGTTVTWVTTPPSGTYTIILVDATASTAKKTTNVSITSSGGSVAYSSFVALPMGY